MHDDVFYCGGDRVRASNSSYFGCGESIMFGPLGIHGM